MKHPFMAEHIRPAKGTRTMPYNQALTHGAKIGASKAKGDGMLALLCQSLAAVHAINPRLVYEGAKKQGLTYKEVAKLGTYDPVALGDLMFL
jgi:hypothetical protein